MEGVNSVRNDLLVRRTKMLNFISKGVPLQTVVDDFSRDYKVSRIAIYKDYERMCQWAPQILQLKDDTLIYELINNVKQVIPNAWFEYTNADNSNAKVGALRLIMDSTLKLVNMLQSLGKIEKAPTRIEAQIVKPIVVKMWTPEDAEKLREKKD